VPRRALHAVWLTLACASFALVGGAGVSRAEPAEECTETGPLVCLSVTPTPDTVSPSREGSPTYVAYQVVVSNDAPNTITHAALAATLPAGSTFVSATSDIGSCDGDGGTVSCPFGSIAGGTGANVEVVVQAPETTGTATASFTVSFDERSNDGPEADPKQDSVTALPAFAVDATLDSAASFVPEGASVELSTDPTGNGVANSGDPQIANAAITSAPAAVSAFLEEVSGALQCPKKVVCRDGDWVQATIPGTYDPPLEFTLLWDASLVAPGQTVKKFAVLLTECLTGCPLEVVSDRCSDATPAASELPCLTGVARLNDGDWVATLVNSHNGYMR
jgi:uncharacterized repeat protein (TIGR01451 family)